jgi:hypothetical protein
LIGQGVVKSNSGKGSKIMKGYIKSCMTGWMHIFKMSVKPGGIIPLSDLYEMYGKKHNIAEKDFVDWLKNVKLYGKTDSWLFVEEEDFSDVKIVPTAVDSLETKPNYETNTKGEIVVSKMSVQEVMGLPVRKAREIIPTVQDIKLLKFALRECKPLPGKESLCRILDKRIMELSMHPTN